MREREEQRKTRRQFLLLLSKTTNKKSFNFSIYFCCCLSLLLLLFLFTIQQYILNRLRMFCIILITIYIHFILYQKKHTGFNLKIIYQTQTNNIYNKIEVSKKTKQKSNLIHSFFESLLSIWIISL